MNSTIPAKVPIIISYEGGVSKEASDILTECINFFPKALQSSLGSVGILYWSGSVEGFYRSFIDLWGKDIRRYVVFSPLLPVDNFWKSIPSAHGKIFKDVFSKPLESIPKLASAIPKAHSPAEWQRQCLAQILESWLIYERLKVFGHGSGKDVTNEYLAPARMFALAGVSPGFAERARWRDSWVAFRKEVIGKLPAKRSDYWSAQLRSLSAPIDSWVSNGKRTPTAAEYEALMSLFTQIRLTAGGEVVSTSSQHTKSKAKIRPSRGTPSALCVLVVDDHADSWQPVFEVVAKRFASEFKRGINFEYSKDCQSVTVPGNQKLLNLRQRILEYDLVLLDIYLGQGGDPKGLTLLEEIRKQSLSLPVIMWTSSLARDLPAQANMANGFLFKKTVTIEKIVPVLYNACVEGEAKQKYSLMHPFFNDAIHSIAERQVARDAQSWVMRLYATFHAQSFDVYRSFNDHSAHHISNVLDNVQKIFRSAGLPNEYIFSLYIGTLLHEIGMFPFDKRESKIFGMPERGRKFVMRVRKLHAIRGMAMLLNPQLWHDDFRDIKSILSPLTKVAERKKEMRRIAVFVGYHARNIDKILELNGQSALVPTHFDKVRDILKSNDLKSEFRMQPPALQRPIIRHALKEITYIPNGEQIAVRQCAAILRFADAMDVDHHRNPVRRFTYARERTFRDDVENFKRVVVVNIEIKDAKVHIVFDAPKPSQDFLECLKLFAKRLKEGFESKLTTKLCDLLQTCHPLQLEKAWESDENRSLVKNLAKPLNELVLDPFWAACHQEDKMGFNKEQQYAIKEMEIKIRRASGSSTRQMQAYSEISTVTSLFVLGDLISEYEAIQDCDLTHAISFGPIKWGKAKTNIKDLEFLDKTPYFDPPT